MATIFLYKFTYHLIPWHEEKDVAHVIRTHIRRVAPLKDALLTERLRHCLSFLESSSGNRGLTRPRRAAAASDSGKNSPIGFRFEKILDVESRKRKTQFRFFVQIEKFREKNERKEFESFDLFGHFVRRMRRWLRRTTEKRWRTFLLYNIPIW